MVGFSNLGYKTYHKFCVNLNKKLKNCKFIVVESSEFVDEYLKKQSEINYIFSKKKEKFDPDKIKIDQEYLDYFEKEILQCSIWKIISSDRQIGRSYLHGISKDTYKFKYKDDRDYILKYFYYKALSIKNNFELYKPDYFIPAIAQGSIDVAIYGQYAKFYKTEYAVLTWLRLYKYCTFASDYQLNAVLFENELLKKIERNFFSTNTEDKYKKLLLEINQKDFRKYSGIITKMNYFEKFDLFFRIFGWPILILKSLYKGIKTSILEINKRDKKKNFFSIFFKSFFSLLSVYKQNIKVNRIGLLTIPKDKKYIYYPLQVQPEYNSNIMSTMWMDSISDIENLSRSIPNDWTVYVKEHPSMIWDRIRPKDYYKQIEKFANVKMINVNVDSSIIVKNSSAVASNSGTTAIEALFMGKTLIETRKNYWTGIGLSAVCTDKESLYECIKSQIKRNNEITKKEREERIKAYIETVLDVGFNQESFDQAFYSLLGTDEQYEKCGNSMANGFIEYLNKIKN